MLVIEDNKDTLSTIAQLLRFEKYEVATAMDGPTGLEMAKRFQPDVVLLDIGLPGMDGYQIAKELRKRASKQPFIAAITGYATESDKERAREAGIDVHLAKPADPSAILDLLEDLKKKR